MIRSVRILLFPFSFIYGWITAIRNFSFDIGLLPSYKSKIKTIAIGNLSMGGTGKTPFTEFLIRQLQRNYKIAVVSRGYGRKSKGFHWVEESSDPLLTGDESLQIKNKFPNTVVAVCEKRAEAIKKIEKECPQVNLILLDDAFQHRYVKADIYILLTTYNNPYWKDYVVPLGRLREWRRGFKRSHFTVITKCQADLSQIDRLDIQKSIQPKNWENVFLAKEKYGKTYGLFDGKPIETKSEAALLVSGIADNRYVMEHVNKMFETVESFNLSDHVIYNKKMIERIRQNYTQLEAQFQTSIIVTEKDAVKLRGFKKELIDLPIAVLPFEHNIWDSDVFVAKLEDKIKN